MIQDLLLPILIVTLQASPDAPQQKPTTALNEVEAFTITYKANGRRSPFIPPSEFTKTDNVNERANLYNDKINTLKSSDIKTQLTNDLNEINKYTETGDVKKALQLTTKSRLRLQNNSDKDLKDLKDQYDKLYKKLSHQVNVMLAKEKLKELNITISGILWAPNSQEAILDGNNIIRPGQGYKGIKINAIGKDAVEFDINGIRLSQSLQ